ncbi:MAG: hypothetical protein N4A57_04825 [Anaeromicrobium sp.]|uniref:phage tail terminator family protein n=1 Tax=Anaeromicrobium sp. TaxID=1929132 RepID=UPI0025F40ED8|nr:hypothetical protein [Anaeromicrobium sp.]MCT4593581.1 hypothetical protein [Anaeromicrobium sp.]
MTLVRIKECITEKLKDAFPQVNIYEKGTKQEIIKPAFFIDFFPIFAEKENIYDQRKLINGTISYDPDNDSMDDRLNMAGQLMETFHDILIVDTRNICPTIMKAQLDGEKLNFTYKLKFMDRVDETKLHGYEEYELMEDLNLKEEF